jgi:Flp pilus assembly protein TadG
MMRVKKSRRRGSVIVELSLIFVLFSTLLIGVMDFGQYLFYQQGVVERVRVAARYGALHDPTDAAAITNVLLYNQSQTPTDGRRTFFNLNASMVNVWTAGAGTDNYRLTVTLSGYSFPMLSLLLASSYPGPPITVSQPLGQYF